MDIFFTDSSEVPLPPEEVRIKELRATPWEDGRRVRIYLEITPFQQRPNGEIIVVDSFGDEVANISIIETIDPKMEVTIHLRGSEIEGEYHATATIFYQEEPEGLESTDEAADLPLTFPERLVVDQSEMTFKIGA